MAQLSAPLGLHAQWHLAYFLLLGSCIHRRCSCFAQANTSYPYGQPYQSLAKTRRADLDSWIEARLALPLRASRETQKPRFKKRFGKKHSVQLVFKRGRNIAAFIPQFFDGSDQFQEDFIYLVRFKLILHVLE